jgi:hypothetical protein
LTSACHLSLANIHEAARVWPLYKSTSVGPED